MGTTGKVLIGVGIVALGGALVVANVKYGGQKAPKVATETIFRRDLEAIVSASGKLRPKRSVNISANTMGTITRLAVQEGDRVERGQFLLQIDPKPYRSQVQRIEAGLQGAQTGLDSARSNLELARENVRRKRELHGAQLIPKEALDQAESELRVREAEVHNAETRIAQERATLDSARHDLSKVTIDAPMTGLITHLAVEEGENAVTGTMNNPGTVLMTIADLSVIEADVEVDETDIVNVKLGQSAQVSIDALPDRKFKGHVTEIGNSAIQPQGAQATQSKQATSFSVIVTIDETVPNVRPGFTSTAEVKTARRDHALAVPIQALTAREVTLDAAGHVVHNRTTGRRRRGQPAADADPASPGKSAGKDSKDVEGVFVIREGRALFQPIKVGIASDKYFELRSGLQEGDQVITGPYKSIRELKDGDPVAVEKAPKK